MANLPAALLTRLATQAPRCRRRLLQPIARRRLAAIAAVFGELPPKISVLLQQDRDLTSCSRKLVSQF
jgi:hypothetical protein